MKERPIIFNAEMVRAILAGNKTQTRRVIKPQPLEGIKRKPDNMIDNLWRFHYEEPFKCPYGEKGTTLWVRETFAPYEVDSGIPEPYSVPYLYRADSDLDIKWKPSIFMPRAASRITLEVTDVRVERVQDISANDCLKEGLDIPPPPGAVAATYPKDMHEWSEFKRAEWFQGTARCMYMAQCHHTEQIFDAFEKLWDSINKKRGFGWDVNPWVFALEFKVLNQ